ncbi:hypothetical protein [Nocardiopsis ansamitocini]|uniref:Uncharacterized protein n=1 Tax=Nocardiopsis ansamitocini TaxID=1670832 RepID=A0A9W6P4D5_9ACTN|nr:hypothetical protein [Nocardiopsis ansamitocini]GLU47110.1 hypothetical protein Nans01_14610 [Nocardiopsis ansamitocini]
MAERTVRFFEILNAKRERLPSQIKFDELRYLVENLPENKAYVKFNKMEILGSAFDPENVEELFGGVPIISLDRITRNPRMRIERRRNYRPLILGSDENLAEPTFYSIFDSNVLGMMRNSGSAPSAASFREYMNKILGPNNEIEIAPLVDKNFLRALRNVDVLTRFDVEVGPNVVSEIFGPARTIESQIKQLRKNLGAVGIQLVIKIDPKGDAQGAEIIHSEIEKLAASGAFTYTERAQIAYRDVDSFKAKTFDFLNESIATSIQVDVNEETDQPRESSVSQSMYAAYEDLFDDIKLALRSVG